MALCEVVVRFEGLGLVFRTYVQTCLFEVCGLRGGWGIRKERCSRGVLVCGQK